MAFDVSLFFFLNSFAGRTALMDSTILFVASWLPYIIVGIFALYLLYQVRLTWKDRILAFATALAAALIARIGIGSPIRYFFPRPRPFITYHVHQLIPENAPSFPSGHALFFFAFSTVVYFYNKKLGVVLWLLSVLVCAARVAAGVHYPSDILAGAVIGTLCGYLVMKYAQPLVARRLGR